MQHTLIFDSRFESGNLDMVIKISDHEYDLYMRVDSNTRGHHQWFYYSIQNQKFKGKVKFNIVNFTKKAALYSQGMRLNIFSSKEVEKLKLQNMNITNEGWTKGGENINYKLSKLCQTNFKPYQKSNFDQDEEEEETSIQRNLIRTKKYF